jgi:hypothetical protein
MRFVKMLTYTIFGPCLARAGVAKADVDSVKLMLGIAQAAKLSGQKLQITFDPAASCSFPLVPPSLRSSCCHSSSKGDANLEEQRGSLAMVDKTKRKGDEI